MTPGLADPSLLDALHRRPVDRSRQGRPHPSLRHAPPAVRRREHATGRRGRSADVVDDAAVPRLDRDARPRPDGGDPGGTPPTAATTPPSGAPRGTRHRAARRGRSRRRGATVRPSPGRARSARARASGRSVPAPPRPPEPRPHRARGARRSGRRPARRRSARGVDVSRAASVPPARARRGPARWRAARPRPLRVHPPGGAPGGYAAPPAAAAPATASSATNGQHRRRPGATGSRSRCRSATRPRRTRSGWRCRWPAVRQLVAGLLLDVGSQGRGCRPARPAWCRPGCWCRHRRASARSGPSRSRGRTARATRAGRASCTPRSGARPVAAPGSRPPPGTGCRGSGPSPPSRRRTARSSPSLPPVAVLRNATRSSTPLPGEDVQRRR